MQLTPKFPVSTPPVRPGVYGQLCGFGKTNGFQYFDGKRWYAWRHTVQSAHDVFVRNMKADQRNNDVWWGLAENGCFPPNAGPERVYRK